MCTMYIEIREEWGSTFFQSLIKIKDVCSFSLENRKKVFCDFLREKYIYYYSFLYQHLSIFHIWGKKQVTF